MKCPARRRAHRRPTGHPVPRRHVVGRHGRRQRCITYSGMTMSICQLRPESRVRVHIRIKSTNPFASRRRNAAQLPGDRPRPAHCGSRRSKAARAIAASSPAMQPLHQARGQAWTGRRMTMKRRCWSFAATTGQRSFTPSGTCAMGQGSGRWCGGGRASLRVHGIDRLARDRLFGDAHAGVGQHQRAHHRHGRESRRPDPRRRTRLGGGVRLGAADVTAHTVSESDGKLSTTASR